MAWTKRAAKNRNASGQISLAISYGIDNILRKDGNSALYWYKKGCSQQRHIGELQKSIAEAAIERLEEAGFNGQNTTLPQNDTGL